MSKLKELKKNYSLALENLEKFKSKKDTNMVLFYTNAVKGFEIKLRRIQK